MPRFVSLYSIAAYYQHEGYRVIATDYRKWHGWSWIKFEMPTGQTFNVRAK